MHDLGPGIHPSIAGRLFEPFVTTKPNGMGLGLLVTRSIVEDHGGKIMARPNPAGGSIFTFTLPAAKKNCSYLSPARLQKKTSLSNRSQDEALMTLTNRPPARMEQAAHRLPRLPL